MSTRIFDIVPIAGAIDDLKLVPNIRVFPLNDHQTIIDSRDRKSKYTTNNLDKFNFLLTINGKETPQKQLSYQSSLNSRIRRSKNDINQRDTSTIVLSDLGQKAPRQPVSMEFPIGINTTMVN